ncbi:MAG: ABC transporter substrate-binding protein [Nitrospiraceae bacterium]|nr:ABC transporter substrate-binding protein [Nitrospiraceae bacterium]
MVNAPSRIAAGFATLVLVLSLMSCGSDDEKGATGKNSTLVIAEAATPTSLDGQFVGNQPQNLEAALNYADPLVQLPSRREADGTEGVDLSQQPMPYVASSFTRAPDGLSFRVVLRKGVKSYLGNEMTTEDLKYLFDRTSGVEGLCGFVMGVSSIDKTRPITVVDKYTADINLTAPNPVLPLALATIPICTILDQAEVKKHVTTADPWAKDWLSTHTAGFGAYHVKSFKPGQETDWVANPNYFKGKLNIQRVIVKAIPETSSRGALLERAGVDVAVDLTPRQLDKLRHNKKISVESRTGSAGLIFGMNNKIPPMDNKDFRQAVAYALPVGKIVSSVFLGAEGVRPAPGYIPVGYPGALADWPYGDNPTEAKRLLARSGVTNPKIELSFNSAQAVDQDVAILIQTALKAVGIDVVLNNLSPAKYFEQYTKRQAQTVLVNDTPFTPDGPYVLGLYFHPDPGVGPANWVNYSNPAVTALINAGLASGDVQERARLTEKANKILVDDAPWGFFLHTGNNLSHLTSVSGYVWQSNNFVRFASFKKSSK